MRVRKVLAATAISAVLCAPTATVSAEPMFGAPAATVSAASAFDITVATFNICNIRCGTGEFAWEKRAPSIVRNILSSGADVIAVQEADKGSAYWLIDALAERGYDWAEPDMSDCDLGCVPDSHVFYKRATMEMAGLTIANRPLSEKCQAFVGDRYDEPPFPEPVLPPLPEFPRYDDPDYDRKLIEWRKASADREAIEQDYYSRSGQWYQQRSECGEANGWTPRISADAGSLAHTSLVQGGGGQLRNMAWAALRHKASGSVVFAASVHLPNEKTPAAEKLRKALGRAIPGFLAGKRKELGASTAPTLIMGDLNSYWQRQPRGAQWILGKQGYRDAYTAKRRINGDVPTINVTGTQRNPFPAKPFRFDKPARLDYVLFDRGRARSYEVHLRLKRGSFDNRFRSSDHNLVRARLTLPSVKVG